MGSAESYENDDFDEFYSDADLNTIENNHMVAIGYDPIDIPVMNSEDSDNDPEDHVMYVEIRLPITLPKRVKKLVHYKGIPIKSSRKMPLVMKFIAIYKKDGDGKETSRKVMVRVR